MEPAEPPPVVIVAPPPPEPAPSEPREEIVERGPPLQNGGVEILVGATTFTPDLSKVSFHGSGVPGYGTQRMSFSHTGGDLGLRSPTPMGGEIDVSYMRRWLAVGLMAYLAAPVGSADQPGDSRAASLVNQATMTAYGFGLDLAAALPITERVAVRVGPLSGVRLYSLVMTGFEPTTCRSKHGDIPCWERATAAHLFVEPRARLELTPADGFVVGGHAGADVIGGGFAAGVFIGFHTPHGKLLP